MVVCGKNVNLCEFIYYSTLPAKWSTFAYANICLTRDRDDVSNYGTGYSLTASVSSNVQKIITFTQRFLGVTIKRLIFAVFQVDRETLYLLLTA